MNKGYLQLDMVLAILSKYWLCGKMVGFSVLSGFVKAVCMEMDSKSWLCISNGSIYTLPYGIIS